MAGFVGALLVPHSIPVAVSDFLVGTASALLIYSLSQTRAQGISTLYASISRRFAGMSYTLYLVHMPLLVFICASIGRPTRWQPDAWHLLAGAAIGGAALVYAWIISSFTEARTYRVKVWLVRTSSPIDRARRENSAYFPKAALIRLFGSRLPATTWPPLFDHLFADANRHYRKSE